MALTDFDVWWCDQVTGNLDTKDRCKRQWLAMEQAGLDCSAITKIMDETWSEEFSSRENAMNDLATLGQEWDADIENQQHNEEPET